MTITLDSTADIIRQFLLNQGLGVDPTINSVSDWPIYVGTLPDDTGIQDNALCLYDTVGLTEGRIQNTGETVEHPGLQVKVRAVSYKAGWAKIWQVAQDFDSCPPLTNINVGEGAYIIQGIHRKPIFALGQEDSEKRRNFFTLNAIATIDSIWPSPTPPVFGSAYLPIGS